ncbi:UDP-N-acetylmuramate dehydrogenase [Anoxybacterium hadale]|uniref:UDP-N-acetylmuramate dehydrogenase n=1 Tax=Anoxybacterium hadale TaxID=3408580 RepID=A0ACD1AHU3_9FIRM|nr:UDP-N-acetylmuramate dehydrogenase [Clostridiales bacterium]
MNISKIYEELLLLIDKNRMVLDAPMKEYTSFKAGGTADLLIIPKDRDELMKALDVVSRSGVEHLIMGNGSNLLVKDGGYRGVIIRMGEGFQDVTTEGSRITAGAGALLSTVAREACNASLAGFEFASGIPGTVGGGAYMNAGAYDGEMSMIIESAEVLSKDGSRIFRLSKDELELSYRHSIFQRTGDVLLNACFLLKEGDQEKISDRIKELTARRTEKQPLSYPSAGSFFKRPPNHFAGKLIQDAGLRGLSLGGAQVSELHSGFLINRGGATASDIVNLMEVIRSTVFENSGVLLEPEVRIVGEDLKR